MSPPFEMVGGRVVYGGAVALDGVDFRLDEGGFVALLGANGSGKTTLVRALVGLAPLTAGTVRVFGVPPREFRGWSRIGFVPQRAALGGGVPSTVREVVFTGRAAMIRRLRPWSRDDRAAVDDALTAVGMSQRGRDPVAMLSGGQQQRVLIARALAQRPTVLLLDEPTAGVDAESEQAFAAVLLRLKAAGTTVLLVAHGLGPLAELVDRSVLLAGGRVVREVAGALPDDHAPHHHLDRPASGPLEIR